MLWYGLWQVHDQRQPLGGGCESTEFADRSDTGWAKIWVREKLQMLSCLNTQHSQTQVHFPPTVQPQPINHRHLMWAMREFAPKWCKQGCGERRTRKTGFRSRRPEHLSHQARSALTTPVPPLSLFRPPAQSQGDCWTPVNQAKEGSNLHLATVPQLQGS